MRSYSIREAARRLLLHKLQRRMGGKVNEKKVAAQAIKDADKARKTEAAIAADWADPNLAKKAAAANNAAAKADEAARKKREKEALLAAEDAALGPGGKIKSKFGAATKKGGSKKKDDFSLLEDALIGDAEKKAKEKKRLERLKKEREAMASIEAERKAKELQANKDPLLANTEAMLGIMSDGDDTDLGGPSLASRNVATMSDVHGTGVDAALSAMSLGGGGKADEHPEKRMKAAYKAYEEKMLPEMKIQYPGLKRQQYLDKIFTSWKKSPENPMNQESKKQ